MKLPFDQLHQLPRSFHSGNAHSLVAFGEGMVNTTYMSRPVRFFICIALSVLSCSLLFCHGQNAKQWSGLSYSFFKGQPTPTKKLLSLLERQARWDEESGVLNPSGLRLRFEKIDEQGTQGGLVTTRYRVFAEGAPENKVYALESWPMDKAISPDPRDIYVNGQGLLMIHKPKPEQEASFKAVDDEFEVTSITNNAEPIRFSLSRRDGQLKVFGTLVPHPVVSEDQGCKIEARVAQPDATAVLIILDGFPAKAKIPLVLESEGATLSDMLATNTDGHAVMAFFPYVPGKTQGTLKASAEGSNCLPSVALPWGPDSHSDTNTQQR
jgi:hypothetical protein